jgi:uncharacterized protein (TIGR03086 family)
MDDLDTMASILEKTAVLVEGTDGRQWEQPTPCAEFDVRALLAHIVGWSHVFAAAASGQAFDGDPSTYVVSGASASDFRSAVNGIVDGWRTHGTDRTVRLVSGEMPGEMVFNMTMMEYLTHGWDLATATGQAIPFTDDEAEATLRRARRTLQPQFRGDSIGPEVEVPASAPAIERLAGFMGRRPAGAS